MIVTADDVGLSPAVTRGALRAAREGVVRSVSIIVNLPESAEAVEAARAVDGLELGLHLNLLAGEPVSDAARVRSLVDADGAFLDLARLGRRLARGAVRVAELALEVRAQARRARELGFEPLAWDSHRHVHLAPNVARVVGGIAREHRVAYVRRAHLPPVSVGRPTARRMLLAAMSRLAAPFYRGLRGNDWYVDLSSWTPPPDPAAVAGLAALDGVGELGAHPGEIDELLRRRDALVERRADELRLLCDPALRAALGDEFVRPRSAVSHPDRWPR